MAESLRDQLIKAGLAPKSTGNQTKFKNKKRGGGQAKINADKAKKAAEGARLEAERAAAEKKALKVKIKEVIEKNHIPDHKGDVVYNYIAGKRVRKVYVKEEIKTLLSSGDLAITRLNGGTYIIPETIGREIIEINPSWAVVFVSDTQELDEDNEYSEYKVPDDVSW